jgi:hypothetical protein
MTELAAPAPPPPPPPPAAPAAESFDFVAPFTYAFEDPRWIQKILIGGLFYLLSFLLVGIFFVLGYMARVTRNVAARMQYPLPEWDDLGGYFNEGVKLFAVSLIYAIPIIILVILMIIPTILVGIASGGHREANDFAGIVPGCFGCLIVPLSLAMSCWIPGAWLMTIMTGQIGAAFEFGRIWAFIRGNLANYLLAIVVFLVARMAAQFGVMLFCIGVLFTAFWALVVAAHALGQVWRLAPQR